MLKVLEDEAAIRKHRGQLIRSFKPFVAGKIRVNLGHPGGALKANILWSERLGLWAFHEKISANRCGHAFGIGKPGGSSSVPISCEINFPLQGIDRRLGGALAVDHYGRVFVVHRGKLGGGKKGVGKSFFEKHHRGAWAVMSDGDTLSTVALVGELNSPRFARQLAQFVRKVDSIKNTIANASTQVEIIFDEPRFREELVGYGYDAPERYPLTDCDHGLVISDLYAALKNQGLRAGNNKQIGLYISNADGLITTVFQVITEPTTPAVHTGMAKLLLTGTDLPENPRLILVAPAGMEISLPGKMKKLGIDILEYKWQEGYAVFSFLSEITVI